MPNGVVTILGMESTAKLVYVTLGDYAFGIPVPDGAESGKDRNMQGLHRGSINSDNSKDHAAIRAAVQSEARSERLE
jgi:hypothetical protein